MSLDLYLEYYDEITGKSVTAFSGNITHNLATMADKAGVYDCLWRPGQAGIANAGELLKCLETGLERLKSNPKKYKKYNSPNEWGVYENLVSFIEVVIGACKDFPSAKVSASR